MWNWAENDMKTCGLPRGVLSTKDPSPTWVAKSASWYINDPLFHAKFWYKNGSIVQIFLKFEPKSKKWKIKQTKQNKTKNQQVIFANFGQNFAKNQGGWYIWIGHFFFESWHLYGSNFKSPAARLYQNQTWVTPCGTSTESWSHKHTGLNSKMQHFLSKLDPTSWMDVTSYHSVDKITTISLVNR